MTSTSIGSNHQCATGGNFSTICTAYATRNWNQTENATKISEVWFNFSFLSKGKKT